MRFCVLGTNVKIFVTDKLSAMCTVYTDSDMCWRRCDWDSQKAASFVIKCLQKIIFSNIHTLLKYDPGSKSIFKWHVYKKYIVNQGPVVQS